MVQEEGAPMQAQSLRKRARMQVFCQCQHVNVYVNSAWVHLKNGVYMGLYIYGLAFDVSALLTTDSLCLPSLSGQGQDTRAWDKFGTEKNMISSQCPLIN
jgi:hypothetical protein